MNNKWFLRGPLARARLESNSAPRMQTSKENAGFHDTTGLVSVHARRTESGTRRVAGGPHKGKVPAHEEALVLKGGRQRDRPGGAARTVHQIDGVFSGIPCARDVFSTPGKGEAVLECVIDQERAACGRCPFRDADVWIRRHI